MPPVISKPTSQTELSQVLNKDKVDEYAPSSVDSSLAHIIMKVAKRLKSSTIGKKKKRKCRFPCSVCSKNVKANAIKCNNCDHWSHAVCNGISKSEYEILVGEDESVPWYCLPCTIKYRSTIFPFGYESNIELFNLYDIDLPSLLEMLPSYDLVSKLSNMPNLNKSDLDENFIHTINSKYHSVSDLIRLNKMSTDFSLFHVNLRSPSKHFDELHSLISTSQVHFDVIGITETKQLINTDFLTNVNMDGYRLHTQPTHKSCGGVGIYVKSSLDYIVRSDLGTCEDEFETLWVESKTGTQSKNILICCAYRHPNSDKQKFIEYMDSTLTKLEKTNKIISVMGDFNINLLGYDSDSETNDFINTMVSHYLLPYILHPTRVTDLSATIIDNIFSNVCEFETISGNIMVQLADHFAQFLIMRKTNVQYKNCSCLQRDYSKFDKDKFIADFSKLSLDNLSCTNLDVNENLQCFIRMYWHVLINTFL